MKIGERWLFYTDPWTAVVGEIVEGNAIGGYRLKNASLIDQINTDRPWRRWGMLCDDLNKTRENTTYIWLGDQHVPGNVRAQPWKGELPTQEQGSDE